MRRSILSSFALFSLLLLMACRNRSITYVTPNGYTVAATEKSQTLEWRMVPTSAPIESFEVSFQGPDPCGPNHPPLIGTRTSPAHCKVTVQGNSKTYVTYQYTIAIKLSGENNFDKGSGPPSTDRVVPCNNCRAIVSGPSPKPNPPSAPGGTSSLPGATLNANNRSQTSDDPGAVVLSCPDSTTIKVTPSNIGVPTSSGELIQFISWSVAADTSPDWTVTFDSSSPCREQGLTFSSTSGQDTCTLKSPLAKGTYTYTATGVQGCSQGGQGTIKIDAQSPR